MTVTITPLTPDFAGEVGAIDLRQVHDRSSLEAIRAGMDKYAVLVFRDQDFTNDEQLDFAQRFDGTLHARTSSSAIGGNRFGNEALADVSMETSASASLPNRLPPMAEDDVRACSVPSNRWAKSSCSSLLKFWSRNTSTAYLSMPARIASSEERSCTWCRSIAPTSPAKSGVSGVMVTVMGAPRWRTRASS